MALGSRPDGKLNLNLQGMSAMADAPSGTTAKSPFGTPKSLTANGGLLGSARLGAGSPLHEQGSRLFPKRTRELQGQTGLSPSIWGPPTSGTSTPLYEIPESPSQDGFPDLVPVTETGINSPARRGRAGTLPSRISPVGTINGVSITQQSARTSRPTPSTSPFKPTATTSTEAAGHTTPPSSSNAALLNRLRAGSLPHRSSYLASSGPFGQSLFSSNWNNRDRAATLTSIKSSDDPSSPAQSNYSKEGLTDTDVRTLDYLGLAETPHQNTHSLFRPLSQGMLQQPSNSMSDLLANLDQRNSNRFRSFSVNVPQKQLAERDEDVSQENSTYGSGLKAQSSAAYLADYNAIQEQIRLHNEAVQAFAMNATGARPRARTAGIVETPQRAVLRNLMQESSNGQKNDLGYTQFGSTNDPFNSGALYALNLNGQGINTPLDGYNDNDSQASRSIWIGSIPTSTTQSSLEAIFIAYGAVESTRVLSQKNCGFVNFEHVDSAVHARKSLNGKEIFPGAGPIRIGFAKAPNTSTSGTPVHIALSPSPTPGTGSAPFGHGRINGAADASSHEDTKPANAVPPTRLSELQPEILQIVTDFGAHEHDVPVISASIDRAVAYQQFEAEIPPVVEPNQARMFDAPRLRDIRKRIDSNSAGLQEIEDLAIEMLPEIADLSSDYLGNTVVQKLFEYCSEHTKEEMLRRIAPHLAEVGVHKNGTWAAQKIIEVCKSEPQIRMIVNSLRPFTVPLFLDQYGNYVIQCCLRFGPLYNDFIFETMLSQLWEIAQGRFGARAMRACLESHHSTKHQQRMLAAAISLHSVQLATNANGALLLTWLLDTCTFPRRRTVLAPRLTPHLVQLCTHKVAYLTVLKVINQRNEPEARDTILQALFFSAGDNVLEQILCDQTSGATMIFKVLTTPFFDDNMRNEIVQNIAKVLTRIKAQPNQGYKRLMDEVGLSARPSHAPVQNAQLHGHPQSFDRARPTSQPRHNSYMSPQAQPRQYPGGYGQNGRQSAYENGQSPIRTGSADSFSFPSYGYNGPQQQSFSPLPAQQFSPQQIQYQNFLAASQRNNGNYTNANANANAYPGYATPPPSVETLRNMQQSHTSPLYASAQMSPIMGQVAFGGAPQLYAPPVAGSMYGVYPPQNFFSPQMQAVSGMGRRGRR